MLRLVLETGKVIKSAFLEHITFLPNLSNFMHLYNFKQVTGSSLISLLKCPCNLELFRQEIKKFVTGASDELYLSKNVGIY